MGRLRRLVDAAEPTPRVVDWSILVCVGFETVSGVVSLGAGHPGNWPLFVAHAVVGLALVALLFYKLRRVRRRVTDRRLWDRATALSVLTAATAVAALGLGVYWALGGRLRVWFWTALNLHIGAGLLLVPLVLVHLLSRAKPLTRADVEGRRTALRVGGLLVGGAVAYRAQDVVAGALDTAAAARRFTGSRPVDPDGNGEADVGAAFPVTSWVADDPDPVDRGAWSLRVDGLVDAPLDLDYGDVAGSPGSSGGTVGRVPRAERRALLDCTSGWYTVQDWRGVRLGDVLDRAGPTDEARWVTVHSVTGYRWSFPLAEARGMLLATHVGGDRLSHGHGAPLRLVAPDRRGFQWVKWVERVEVRRRRDPAQYVATLVSGFD
jgi:DMSO/TMAO reductase YedYZ molybdopterin-dependent catalytic subunit